MKKILLFCLIYIMLINTGYSQTALGDGLGMASESFYIINTSGDTIFTFSAADTVLKLISSDTTIIYPDSAYFGDGNVVIEKNGAIGIGITTPRSVLDIARGGANANIYVSTYRALLSAGSSINIFKSYSNTVGELAEGGTGSLVGRINFLTIDNTNNIETCARIETIQSNLSGSFAPAYLAFSTWSQTGQNNYQLVLEDDDDVGISTASPTSKLDVAGGIVSSISDTVASAATLTLGNYNNFVITGTTGIDSLDTDSDCPNWMEVYLKFEASVTITEGKNLNFGGSGNISATAGDIYKFMRIGNNLHRIQ